MKSKISNELEREHVPGGGERVGNDSHGALPLLSSPFSSTSLMGMVRLEVSIGVNMIDSSKLGAMQSLCVFLVIYVMHVQGKTNRHSQSPCV